MGRSDNGAAFVFRTDQSGDNFQVYFGDGTKTCGLLTVSADGFLGVRSTLRYLRGEHFSVISLESPKRREVRFCVHHDVEATKLSENVYFKGDAEDGVRIFNVRNLALPRNGATLCAAAEFFDYTRDEKSPSYYRSLNTLAAEFFSNKAYDKALRIFQHVSSASSLNIHIVAFTKARSCINHVCKTSERGEAWGQFSSVDDQLFGRIKRSLEDGNSDIAAVQFSEAVAKVFGEPPYRFDIATQQKLVQAFATLIEIDSNTDRVLPSFKAVRVAIVSGMGWSGSGAVYDYLKEFSEIVPIQRETPYIEGGESLRVIYSSLADDKLLKERILNFFFYVLIGHGYYRNNGDFKLFKDARRKLQGKARNQYIDAIYDWCTIASAMCAAKGEDRKKLFLTLCDFTVSRFSVGQEIPDGKIALLDNVVHIGNAAKCIEFLSNVAIFCTFRDPRSNYVALVREAGHFTSTAAEYIEEQKAKIDKGFQSARSAKLYAESEPGKVVEIVSFEEFVLSEAYRRSLAAKLGLSVDSQARYKYFKPWESMRNITLHHEHPDQDEIKLIETELGDYCYEPCVRQLREKVSNTNKGEQYVI